MENKWEKVTEDTYRLRVFGGWIVDTMVYDENGLIKCNSTVFVPDKEGLWNIQ